MIYKNIGRVNKLGETMLGVRSKFTEFESIYLYSVFQKANFITTIEYCHKLLQ